MKGRPEEVVGGNGLFCALWDQYKFKRQPVAISPENPTLTCGSADPSVTFTASGGRPGPDGYSWSVSNPNAVLTLTGVNKQNATLKPSPTNPNVNGEAYVKQGTSVNADCSPSGSTQSNIFDCFDQQTGGTNVPLCSLSDPLPIVCSGGGLCPQHPTSCSNEVGVPIVSQRVNEKGFLCDRRNAFLISQGCNPCRLQFGLGGSTVTVTDAAGASAATTATAQ